MTLPEPPEWLKRQLYETIMRELLTEPPLLAYWRGRPPHPPPAFQEYTPERFEALVRAIVTSEEPVEED